METKIIDESEDRKYFTIVPNYILNHSTAIDQALYMQMKRAAGDKGSCFMTEQTMCGKLGIGRDALWKSLKYLQDHHWIEFVGMTPSKTRPIKTYKVNDIWKLNVEYYNEAKQPHKISPETDISFNSGDKSSNRHKISPQTDIEEEPIIRRTNKQHEAKASVIKKNVDNHVDNPKGISSIGDILKRGDPGKYTGKARTGGASYEWQDHAVRVATKLGIKPNGSWFKLFKTGKPSIIDATLSLVADAKVQDPEKYFYKIYYNKVRGIKPTWQL